MSNKQPTRYRYQRGPILFNTVSESRVILITQAFVWLYGFLHTHTGCHGGEVHADTVGCMRVPMDTISAHVGRGHAHNTQPAIDRDRLQGFTHSTRLASSHATQFRNAWFPHTQTQRDGLQLTTSGRLSAKLHPGVHSRRGELGPQ